MQYSKLLTIISLTQLSVMILSLISISNEAQAGEIILTFLSFFSHNTSLQLLKLMQVKASCIYILYEADSGIYIC